MLTSSIAVCAALPSIPNGMISYAPDMTPLYDIGTVATYTCNEGFRFIDGVGDQMRTCEVGGMEGTREPMFSGSAPQCEPGRFPWLNKYNYVEPLIND